MPRDDLIAQAGRTVQGNEGSAWRLKPTDSAVSPATRLLLPGSSTTYPEYKVYI